jgi:putative sigma-54 modulation protein
MKVDISGRHFKVLPALQEYVESKVQKLDKYSLKLESARVVLEVQKFRHIAEITLRGKDLRLVAKEEEADMYAAFDLCFGNAQLQLSRKHDKSRDHKGRRYTAASGRAKKA